MTVTQEVCVAEECPTIHLAADPQVGPAQAPASVRVRYHRLLHADAHGEGRALASALVNETVAAFGQQPLPAWLAPLAAAAPTHPQAWREAAAREHAVQASAWHDRVWSLAHDRQALLALQLAPFTAIDGCWLQHASSALNSHDEAASLLLRSYLRRTLVDGTPPGPAFIGALRRARLEVSLPASQAFAANADVDSAMYELPVFALALSQFPTLLLPEILGFNLACALRGHEPLLGALDAEGLDARLLRALADPARHAALQEEAFAAIAAAGASWPRVVRGLRIAHALFDRRDEALRRLSNADAFSPAARMADLLRRKAPVAAGYHGRVEIAAHTLEQAFGGAASDPHALLAVLANSRYVVPGHPELSPLVTSASSPRGTMAGVFDAQEIATVSEWIRSLGDAHAVAPQAQARVDAVAPPAQAAAEAVARAAALVPVLTADAEKQYARLSVRELYHRLLHAETWVDALPYARRFAAWWLSRAATGVDRGEQAIPFAAYSHAAFDAWLQERHRAQVATYAPSADTPLPTREELVESCVQLCPMVLIDGAWLQRIGQVSTCGGEVGRRLYKIYLDEVGGGDARENHPNLYRELMTAMEVELPAFGTPEFAHWPRFADASFRLPVFWLCLSLFPQHFLAETLGLTLAVEISGVGGTYRSTSDALRHHGFPSTFVDVHNTIDNIASGHTALAHEAIKAHLDEGLEQGGPDEVQRRWRRVWTGWLAITPPAALT
jgi:hypothetical protein